MILTHMMTLYHNHTLSNGATRDVVSIFILKLHPSFMLAQSCTLASYQLIAIPAPTFLAEKKLVT